MKYLHYAILPSLLAAAVGLQGCGSSSSDNSTPTTTAAPTTTLSGTASKGPIRQAQVRVRGADRQLIDTANTLTDANGDYSIDIPSNATGPFTIEIVPTPITTQVCDTPSGCQIVCELTAGCDLNGREAENGDVQNIAFGEEFNFINGTLRAIVPSIEANATETTVNVTPFTEIAASLVDDAATLSVNAVNSANQQVASQLGQLLADNNVNADVPTDIFAIPVVDLTAPEVDADESNNALGVRLTTLSASLLNFIDPTDADRNSLGEVLADFNQSFSDVINDQATDAEERIDLSQVLTEAATVASSLDDVLGDAAEDLLEQVLGEDLDAIGEDFTREADEVEQRPALPTDATDLIGQAEAFITQLNTFISADVSDGAVLRLGDNGIGLSLALESEVDASAAELELFGDAINAALDALSDDDEEALMDLIEVLGEAAEVAIDTFLEQQVGFSGTDSETGLSITYTAATPNTISVVGSIDTTEVNLTVAVPSSFVGTTPSFTLITAQAISALATANITDTTTPSTLSAVFAEAFDLSQDPLDESASVLSTSLTLNGLTLQLNDLTQTTFNGTLSLDLTSVDAAGVSPESIDNETADVDAISADLSLNGSLSLLDGSSADIELSVENITFETVTDQQSPSGEVEERDELATADVTLTTSVNTGDTAGSLTLLASLDQATDPATLTVDSLQIDFGDRSLLINAVLIEQASDDEQEGELAPESQIVFTDGAGVRIILQPTAFFVDEDEPAQTPAEVVVGQITVNNTQVATITGNEDATVPLFVTFTDNSSGPLIQFIAAP